MKKLGLLLCMLVGCQLLQGQESDDLFIDQKTRQDLTTYSKEVREKFHEDFDLVRQFEGGELSRYVNTHITEFFPNISINRPPEFHMLPSEQREDIGSFLVPYKDEQIPLKDYILKTPVDGLLILHQGKIVFESYPRMQPTQRHLLMSISKVFVSTLIGILEERGLIDIQKSIAFYITDLQNTAWEDISILNILDMASGICWEFEKGMETYNDFDSCYMQFEGSIGWSPSHQSTPSNPYEAIKAMKPYKAQGLSNDYSGINTFLLGWLMEEVTGERFTTLLEREIWKPMGAEGDGFILTPKRNTSAVYGGLSSTLRDLGRFGLLFTPSSSKEIVSKSLVQKIQQEGRPTLLKASISIPFNIELDGEKPVFSTYQWDFTMEDGDFYKSGFLGQGLYVSPNKDLVIAYFGTYGKDGEAHDLKNISRMLAKSKLFN